MRAKKPVEHAEVRRQLDSDVAAFLQNGGEIFQATHEDTKMYRDRMAAKEKSKPGAHPMTVNHKHPGATPDHRWRNKRVVLRTARTPGLR